MINLLTGTPGAGKTCWLVNHLMTDPTVSQRPLFVHGIPHLKLPHEPIYCNSPVCEPCGKIKPEKKQGMLCAEDWHEWAPDGALIVIDEVQNVWRPRASASKLPDSVAKLETHRHRGLDFWIISQGPHLFDSNVRRLIGRHIHLRSSWKGRSEFEWPECKDNVQSTSDAVERSYRLPKRAFEMYQSASLHTIQKHRIPLGIYVVGVCLVLFVIMGYTAVTRFRDKVEPVMSPESGAGGGEAAPAATLPAGPTLTDSERVMKKKRKLRRFEPEERGRPETADAYAKLLVVRDYPFPSACIRDHKLDTCQCYTNQGTPYDMPKLVCHEYAAGRVFNPYKKPRPVYRHKAPKDQTMQVENSPEVPLYDDRDDSGSGLINAPAPMAFNQ